MIGASIDSGPSPSTAAQPDEGSVVICSVVIEKSAATPAGRNAAGSAKTTLTGNCQTSWKWVEGSSGGVQVDSRIGSPSETRSTAAFANFLVSIAVRAAAQGPNACSCGASSDHCDAESRVL